MIVPVDGPEQRKSGLHDDKPGESERDPKAVQDKPVMRYVLVEMGNAAAKVVEEDVPQSEIPTKPDDEGGD